MCYQKKMFLMFVNVLKCYQSIVVTQTLLASHMVLLSELQDREGCNGCFVLFIYKFGVKKKCISNPLDLVSYVRSL